MAAARSRRGCLQGCVIPLLAFIIIFTAIFLYTSTRFGGFEGVKRWIANKALSGVEASILEKLPADTTGDININPERVKAEFEAIKKANQRRSVDLDKLNDLLSKYQRKVGKSSPSAKQVEDLLSSMKEAIISSDKD